MVRHSILIDKINKNYMTSNSKESNNIIFEENVFEEIKHERCVIRISLQL